ncbi:hypothetical protein VSDG_07457 [Cytospora chrysosperma]|uniref:Uncharacterized protein n=1 Tax=Cytospora chrysosperma TaxID=252740 RepID=A0A423VI58_CYTCH|nr:hypothetical protein VSDG_07457 [Valsa sordida]
MAFLRSLSSTSTLVMRSALLPRFSLNHAQIRTVLTLSAFEKVMQDIHGAKWREALNSHQKKYVNYKEAGREVRAKQMKEEIGENWEAVAAENAANIYASEKFQAKYQRLKGEMSRDQ